MFVSINLIEGWRGPWSRAGPDALISIRLVGQELFEASAGEQALCAIRHMFSHSVASVQLV